ncbi:conserved hypothetical protein [[Clostridium] ultunense Esp]|uniref:ribonuclease H-like YkuK family protein n=1 Tax=Thermicanus aegyptius TaxID=94009 RepID=UPI0002B6F2EF|nr:ribonuclease H-like YkuK family protein [Thermicanus aegyptius]MBE3553671.1 ribonuclease H-like YkuK family protein [Thermicanus sp.]CCQ98206.1 conserved hypothetical protein [[Clostridium] ultunense Esp]
MYFISPTYGRLTFQEVISFTESFIHEDPNSSYKLVIGTDSQTTAKETILVTALIIHRIGKGARFFFNRKREKPIFDLRNRIYHETARSLAVIQQIEKDNLLKQLVDLPVEIHIDIGQRGETRAMIQEVVGWVTSVGYVVKIKPYSYGASSVADRLTKSSHR